MPLVKNARITTDLFVHVADGAELPGDGDDPDFGGSAFSPIPTRCCAGRARPA